jgi:hypothetical protein
MNPASVTCAGLLSLVIFNTCASLYIVRLFSDAAGCMDPDIPLVGPFKG